MWTELIIISIIILIILLVFGGCNRKENFGIIALNEAIANYSPDMTNYNDMNTRTKYVGPENHNNGFENTFYSKWQNDIYGDKIIIEDTAKKVLANDLYCVNFQNVNQCMSVCSNTNKCSGFYINEPNKCCMMTKQNLDDAYKKNKLSELPNNVYEHASGIIDYITKNKNISEDRLVFTKAGNDGFNDTYSANTDQNTCKEICPKCIFGRCPDNYRCTNLKTNPHKNQSCVITNEGRYDENIGHTFDGNHVPYLDDKYAIDQFADYHPIFSKPNLTKNQSYKMVLT